MIPIPHLPQEDRDAQLIRVVEATAVERLSQASHYEPALLFSDVKGIHGIAGSLYNILTSTVQEGRQGQLGINFILQ